jgi:UDP-hydrolysing UDP-N-acetyl-D-glucosamine 2-epimerase
MIRITFFSSTRADSGILKPVIISSLADYRFETRVIVSGGHLDESQGATLVEEFSYLDESHLVVFDFFDRDIGLVASMPSALSGFLRALTTNNSDLVVVLGDRMETLLFTFAASISNIPIVHLHGGDLTRGAMDELFRHAITKLSALHFPASDEAANRVIQMGETPDAVFPFGSPVKDLITSREAIPKQHFLEQVGLPKEKPFFLITMHPAIHDKPSTTDHLIALIEALEEFQGHHILFTAPNLDPGSHGILRTVQNYVNQNSNRATLVESLGSIYFDALTYCDLAIGNSSSLVLEAPLLGVRTLLIGRRQEGRTQDQKFFGASSTEIAAGIRFLVSQPKPDPDPSPSSSVSASILDTIASRYPVSTEKRFHEL